jgi:hypothetical protein
MRRFTIFFLICGASALPLIYIGRPFLSMAAMANAYANLWLHGVMHNYAVRSPAERITLYRDNLDSEGKLKAEKERKLDDLKLNMKVQAVPSWLTIMYMLTILIGIVFFGYGIWQLL